MNNIDKNPDYKKMYSFVCDLFKASGHFYYGPHDETYYSLKVFETSKELIKKIDEKVNVPLILVASILHDVGKAKLDFSKVYLSEKKMPTAMEEWNRHPALGVPVAKDFLKTLGHSDEFIKDVCFLVEFHAARKSDMKKSLELQLLQDADLIADMGLPGFIRPFLFSGKFKRSVIDSIRHIKKDILNERRIDMLNLDVSKDIFIEKSDFEKELFEIMLKDLDSELLN